MISVEKKKKIGILTMLLQSASMVFTFIDALVAVNYPVLPEVPSADFTELVIEGPIWWKINPILFMVLISVGVFAFILGNDTERDIKRPKEWRAFLPLVFTFIIISASGLGDAISQSFIEILSGNSPLYWLARDWWWTKFLPLPFVVSTLRLHAVPTGLDMLICSVIGIFLLGLMWLRYYDVGGLQKLKFFGQRGILAKKEKVTQRSRSKA
jgi:hypothetical protein